MSGPGLRTALTRFVYGTPQLVASGGALIGLGLYFAGVIDALWWAIVAGLYAAGYLITRALVDDEAIGAELDEARLQQELEALLRTARPNVPAPAQTHLETIAERAATLIPALDDLTERGVIGLQVRHDVLLGLTRYLPDTLGAYLALPPAYLKLHHGKPSSPDRHLAAQLALIDAHLARCVEQAFAEQAAELAVQGRFLADKMGHGDLPGHAAR